MPTQQKSSNSNSGLHCLPKYKRRRLCARVRCCLSRCLELLVRGYMLSRAVRSKVCSFALLLYSPPPPRARVRVQYAIICRYSIALSGRSLFTAGAVASARSRFTGGRFSAASAAVGKVLIREMERGAAAARMIVCGNRVYVGTGVIGGKSLESNRRSPANSLSAATGLFSARPC